MASAQPPLPPQFKALQHYLKTASEHDSRNVVVAYYCRLYALQRGMQIDMKTPECRQWLTYMMDYLENMKKQHEHNEAIHTELVGHAHIEQYALQLFVYADNEDRAGRFGKNVVKSYYTAAMLLDVSTAFGDISDDVDKNRKYAKWKAAYIHRCLKNGETPIAGPFNEEGEEEDVEGADAGAQYPAPSSGPPSGARPAGYAPVDPGPGPSQHLPPPGVHAPPTTPSDTPKPVPAAAPRRWEPPSNPGAVQLQAEHYQRAMKLCKFAGSALQYEDSKTAIDNLTKALKLLTTGQE